MKLLDKFVVDRREEGDGAKRGEEKDGSFVVYSVVLNLYK